MNIIRHGQLVHTSNRPSSSPLDAATIAALQQRAARTVAEMSLSAQLLAARYRAGIAAIQDPALRDSVAGDIFIGQPYRAAD